MLLALVDANYRFLYIDVGAYGRNSDGGVYNASSLSRALETNAIDMPSPDRLGATDIISPYTIIADDAFPLKTYLMKPYSQRGLQPNQIIFNYRLSRARRIVENAFGHICQRFRVLRQPIQLAPHKVEIVVFAICCLHNYLLRDVQSETVYLEDADKPEPLPASILPLAQQGGNRATFDAYEVRDTLCKYVNGAGSVPWQAERAIEL